VSVCECCPPPDFVPRINRFVALAEEQVTIVLPEYLARWRWSIPRGQVVVARNDWPNYGACLHTPWLILVQPQHLNPKVVEELLVIQNCAPHRDELYPVVLEF
jgi:hypothetical protein